GRRPIEGLRLPQALLGHLLPAQPEDVPEQKEEDEEAVLLRDAVEADGRRGEGPQTGREQRHLCPEEFARDEKDEEGGECAEECARQARGRLNRDLKLRVLARDR